jgi:Icc-related predicted phosphoesterase
VARTRIYFVSDVHASERCWLKFLAAPKFYEADTVIIGGDITGKFIVPIRVQANGNWLVENFLGRQWRLKTREELAKLKAHIADTGQYAFETTDEEYAEYEGDQPKIDELFRTLALERVRRWVDMAEDRLGPAGIRCLVSAGNDDFYEVDELLRASSLIQNPDGRVLDLGDGFQIMGIGYGNPTPWNCPHDPGWQHSGARRDHALPAHARAARAHPRVQGSAQAGPDQGREPRKRVRRGRARRRPDRPGLPPRGR